MVATGNSTLDDMVFTPDSKTLVFTRQSGAFPTEIVRVNSSGGAPVQLTHFNDAVLASHQLTPLEESVYRSRRWPADPELRSEASGVRCG